MLHNGKINPSAILSPLTEGYTSLTKYIFKIIRTGTAKIKDEQEIQRVILVNALSLSLVIMTATVGMIFFLISGELIILIPALIESALAFCGLYFNYLQKQKAAALVTYYIQCGAALYFGLVLGKVVDLHLMIVFLMLIALRIFPDKEQKVTRTLCLFSAILIMVVIELGYRFHLVDTIPLNSTAFDIFYYIALAGVMLLIYIIGKPYVQSNDMLILANYFKRMFVAKICHELRNVINNVGLAAHLSKSEIEKDYHLKKIEPLVDVLLLSSNAATSIVNSVLSMTKIEKGEADPLAEQTFFADKFFFEIISVYKIAAASRGLKIKYTKTPQSPEIIKADSVKLNHIFTNLLGNAIKYGEKLSTVRVIRCQKGDDFYIEVINSVISGRGIPVAKQQTIFDPYVTNKHDYTTEGTGLGLFIAQNMANAMGGEITLECSSNEVKFILCLPISEGSIKDIPPEAADLDLDCTGLKVLIADDDSLGRMLLQRLIQSMGGEVNCVADGEEAITALQQQRYDLILTDLYMPNLNGIGLLKFIKRDDSPFKAIPVIVVTGESAGFENDALSEHNFDGVLHKPINTKSLRDLFEKHTPVNKILVDFR